MKVLFWERVRKGGPDECWEWTGTTDKGYGTVTVCGRMHRAHRVSLRLLGIKRKSHTVIDHICRNKVCVNPKHLRQISSRQNILCGISFSAHNARKTHCKNGHEFTKENTYHNPKWKRSWRECRACKSIGNKVWKQKRREASKNPTHE